MSSVITPPTATALTELATLKAELAITGTAQDSALSGYIEQASALIDLYCGRKFAQAQWQDVFRLAGSQRRSLVLGQSPIVEVESVNVDGQAITQDAIDMDTEAGILHPPLSGNLGCSNFGVACWYGHRIVVIYTAGYVLPGADNRDLPLDIERACLITARALYFAPGRGDPLIRSEAEQGVGSTSYLDPMASNGGLPLDAVAILSGYQRGGLA